MNKLKFPGKKANASILIRSRISVFQIAFDRTTDFCKLSPYLVMTSGMELYLKQEITV
jgi:hypothetical protein